MFVQTTYATTTAVFTETEWSVSLFFPGTLTTTEPGITLPASTEFTTLPASTYFATLTELASMTCVTLDLFTVAATLDPITVMTTSSPVMQTITSFNQTVTETGPALTSLSLIYSTVDEASYISVTLP